MSMTGPPAPWYRQVAAVIPQHMALKSIGTTTFISAFFGAYFYLLRHPASVPTVMPITWVDRLIGFEPLALPLYLSLWVYVSLLPALFSRRHELYRYASAMGLMCLAALAIFYFWPTTVPAPEIDWTQYPDLGWLKNIDAAGNANPSLHVATALFSGIWMRHLLRRFGAPAWIHLFNAAWCGAIIYSTMAVRQHVALDVAGGLLLGAVVAWLSLRHAARTPADVAPGESPP